MQAINLLYTLVERFWDATDTVHLSFEEMTVAPHDFALITSLTFEGTRVSLHRVTPKRAMTFWRDNHTFKDGLVKLI